MLHVHKQVLGFDFEICLQRAVRNFTRESHTRLKQILQECALESLALLIVSLLTVTTLVWVVTTVADTHTSPTTSFYQNIPMQTIATSANISRGLTPWANDPNGESWLTQWAAEAGH